MGCNFHSKEIFRTYSFHSDDSSLCDIHGKLTGSSKGGYELIECSEVLKIPKDCLVPVSGYSFEQ